VLLLNDVHSRLNATAVSRVVRVRSPFDVRAAVLAVRERGEAVSVAGGRHAMGGQQFGAGTVHVDTTALRRVVSFDRDSGLLEVEAGIHWDALVAGRSRTSRSPPGGASPRSRRARIGSRWVAPSPRTRTAAA
jgi:FAD/FMN-containing dehydrogenase